MSLRTRFRFFHDVSAGSKDVEGIASEGKCGFIAHLSRGAGGPTSSRTPGSAPLLSPRPRQETKDFMPRLRGGSSTDRSCPVGRILKPREITYLFAEQCQSAQGSSMQEGGMKTAAQASDAVQEAVSEVKLPSNSSVFEQGRVGLGVFDSTNGSRERGTRDDQGTA